MVDLTVISYRLFRNQAKFFRPYFQDIESDLKKAGIQLVVDEYISFAILSSVIGFVASYFVFTFLIFLLTRSLLLSIMIPIFAAVFFAMLTFTVFYFYPSQIVETKNKKIKNALHFVTIYMATLAGTGVPPYELFRMIGNFEEFGEVSKLCRKLYRDLTIFGLDLPEALARASDYSPNEDLRELMWGIRTTITTGGDLRMYLIEKARAYTQVYRRGLQEYVKVLSIFMEMYITIVIVGSVFVLVLTTIMSLLGGYMEQIKFIQTLLIVVGLPFTSAVFILLLKTISPTEV